MMMNTTARAHTDECRRRLENCLAEDEETKFRSGFASQVESTDKSRGGDAVSRAPSGVASSSAPAAAASGSAPAVASSSSAAAERFQSDEVLDHGVKRVRWSPHVDTSEMSPGEVEDSRGLERQPESATEDLEDARDQGDADDDDMNAIGGGLSMNQTHGRE